MGTEGRYAAEIVADGPSPDSGDSVFTIRFADACYSLDVLRPCLNPYYSLVPDVTRLRSGRGLGEMIRGRGVWNLS